MFRSRSNCFEFHFIVVNDFCAQKKAAGSFEESTVKKLRMQMLLIPKVLGCLVNPTATGNRMFRRRTSAL